MAVPAPADRHPQPGAAAPDSARAYVGSALAETWATLRASDEYDPGGHLAGTERAAGELLRTRLSLAGGRFGLLLLGPGDAAADIRLALAADADWCAVGVVDASAQLVARAAAATAVLVPAGAPVVSLAAPFEALPEHASRLDALRTDADALVVVLIGLTFVNLSEPAVVLDAIAAVTRPGDWFVFDFQAALPMYGLDGAVNKLVVELGDPLPYYPPSGLRYEWQNAYANETAGTVGVRYGLSWRVDYNRRFPDSYSVELVACGPGGTAGDPGFDAGFCQTRFTVETLMAGLAARRLGAVDALLRRPIPGTGPPVSLCLCRRS